MFPSGNFQRVLGSPYWAHPLLMGTWTVSRLLLSAVTLA